MCSPGPSQLSCPRSSLRFAPDLGPLSPFRKPTSENGTFVAAKRKPPSRRPASENGTFVADDWNCRRNQHRNQSASPDCPVGGLSRRFSLESVPLPFSELTQSPVQPPDTTNVSLIPMRHNGCHPCHRGPASPNSPIIATSDSHVRSDALMRSTEMPTSADHAAQLPHRPVGRAHHPFHHRLAEWELS